jgi:hypothetical protein
METFPEISSFVIRLIQDPSPGTTTPFRGSIRHVQTDQELSFTDISDAVDFIYGIMPIDSLIDEDKSRQE